MQHMEENCRVVDATHGRKLHSCGCNTWKETAELWMQHMEENSRVVNATHGRKLQSCGCNTWKKTA